MKRIILFFFLIYAIQSRAQSVSGTVRDDKGAALPFASIIVKGTSKGVVANSQGKYSINLSSGSYALLCQHVGYKTEEKTVEISQENVTADFRLSIRELKMDEVVIKRGQDPAVEIMRRTIAKRDYYNKQVDSMTVDVYIKGLLRSRFVPDKFMGQKIDRGDMKKDGLDSAGKGILFLSESVTKVAYKKPDKIKYEVVSSRQSGGGFGLSFPFFIDFYTSNVSIFSGGLNPRGFISPVSDNAFHYYIFHFEGDFFDGNKMIDRIKVTPRRKNEPLFEGYIEIVDGEWRIYSIDLFATKDHQLELLDTLRITQVHAPVTNDIWRTQNQVVYVSTNFLGFGFSGNFLNIYSNYNLNPPFKRKYFDRVIMKYDTAFNKKDSSYWADIRPVPLEADERRDYVFKDSVKAERDSMFTRRNIDSLRKQQKPVKVQQFFRGGVTRNFYSPNGFSTYRFEPLLKGVEYNTVEGLNLSIDQSLNIRPKGGKFNYNIASDVRYGFSNTHLNAYLTLRLIPKGENFRNRYLEFSGGKRVSQFNHENPIGEYDNSIYSLLSKKNFMKIYENWFGKVEYNNRFVNGIRWNINATYEDRIPVENTTDFSFLQKERTFTPNHPYELANIPFNRHQAVVASASLIFQPGQRYIEFPQQRVPVGSKFPTFELNYSKGIPNVFNSIVDYDKWKLSVYDDMNFRLGGLLRYKVSIGGFLNSKHAEIPDFQHFIGNQTAFASEYLNSFQLAPYYQYSNTQGFYATAHIEHHFNGLLTNKIPLFNKLKWNLVVGTNTFYVNNKDYYVEGFVGLENILKIFRVDFVTATQSQSARNYGIIVGFGGILGGAMQGRRR